MDDIKQMLDELYDTQCAVDLLMLDKQVAIASVLTDEIKAQIADIETEFAGKADGGTKRIAELTEMVKNAAPEMTATVKGKRKMAVLTPPKVEVRNPTDVAAYADTHPPVKRYLKWTVEADAEGLERYAKDDPGVLPFLSYTKPKVAIRDVK